MTEREKDFKPALVSSIDLCVSICDLLAQLAVDQDRQDKPAIVRTCESIITDCNMALEAESLTKENRAWFEEKKDHAQKVKKAQNRKPTAKPQEQQG